MINNDQAIAHAICKFFTEHRISDPEGRDRLYKLLTESNSKLLIDAYVHGIFLQYDKFMAEKLRGKIEILMHDMSIKDQKIKELQKYIDDYILKP